MGNRELVKTSHGSQLLSPKLSSKKLKVKTPVSTKKVYDPSQRTIQLEDLVPTKIIAVKPVRDFFGRIVEVKKVADPVILDNFDFENQSIKKVVGVAADVLFKFKEGYSNAVRKPLYVRDLKR